VVRLEWKSDFPVFRTAMDTLTTQAVIKAIERAKRADLPKEVELGWRGALLTCE
jgi:hypothetical protein